MRNAVIWLVKIFWKEGIILMAMLFACRIIEERTTFEQVPRLLKQQVADIIITNFGMPELVPVEYGGTMTAEA